MLLQRLLPPQWSSQAAILTRSAVLALSQQPLFLATFALLEITHFWHCLHPCGPCALLLFVTDSLRSCDSRHSLSDLLDCLFSLPSVPSLALIMLRLPAIVCRVSLQLFAQGWTKWDCMDYWGRGGKYVCKACGVRGHAPPVNFDFAFIRRNLVKSGTVFAQT